MNQHKKGVVRAWRVITFEASWLDEEVCRPLRALLEFMDCPASTDARGATGSGTGLFLEADGGKSGWLCVAVLSESAGFESPRLDCVSSLDVSSIETCEKGRVSKHKHVDEDKGDQPRQGSAYMRTLWRRAPVPQSFPGNNLPHCRSCFSWNSGGS